ANIDPVADAGEATALISLAAPDSGILDLNGVVEEDDGYPLVPGAMTIEWTADDPLVGFGDPALAGTTANFNTAGEGTYVLTLTADDGGGNPGVDTIVVTVSKYAMAEIVLAPTDDTFVRAARGPWNFGGETTIDTTNSLLEREATGVDVRLGLLKFDIHGQVPGVVENATLRIKSLDPADAARITAMTYGPSGEWFEGNGLGDNETGDADTTGVGITWNTFDLVEVAELDYVAPIADDTWFDFDVAGMAMANDGKVTISIESPGDTDTVNWRSKDGSADAPSLIVTYYSSAAYGLVPVPDQVEVHPNATLTWRAGSGADTEEIYFGEAGSMVLVNTNTAVGTDPNEYDPSPASELALGTVYEWEIISIAGGNIIGETGVRTFATMLLHPDVPVNVSPLDLAVDVVRPVVFDFIEGEDANSTGDHDLLIGTESSVLVEKVDGILPGNPNATLADLALATEYFWQIRAVGTGGTYSSVETSFTTEECEVFDDFEDTLVWTGAAVLETTIVDEGLQAMAINYSDGEGQATATLSLGGADLEALNGALLHIR
ncbi:MAG: hypothetical protein KAJ19_10935, partial [Gammaproteobacteria bacterium]|nr:hypothetical protein [Gammaproteobacteria bacterium]